MSKKLGIEKKTSRAKLPPNLTNSREVQKGSEPEPHMNSSSVPCGAASAAETLEGIQQQGLEAPDWNEEGCFSPLWAIHDDLELTTNCIMELNGCSLDLGWHVL